MQVKSKWFFINFQFNLCLKRELYFFGFGCRIFLAFVSFEMSICQSVLRISSTLFACDYPYFRFLQQLLKFSVVRYSSFSSLKYPVCCSSISCADTSALVDWLYFRTPFVSDLIRHHFMFSNDDGKIVLPLKDGPNRTLVICF